MTQAGAKGTSHRDLETKSKPPPATPMPSNKWFGFDIEQPQQYLRLRVGKLLFEAGRTRDAERYFRSFNPYEYFSATQAELYVGRIAEASGRPEEL